MTDVDQTPSDGMSPVPIPANDLKNSGNLNNYYASAGTTTNFSIGEFPGCVAEV